MHMQFVSLCNSHDNLPTFADPSLNSFRKDIVYPHAPLITHLDLLTSWSSANLMPEIDIKAVC